MLNLETKDILVRMLPTPNPYAFKFVLNVPLKNEGSASFYSKEDCKDFSLFASLFDIQGIKQIYVLQNQMTVSHEGHLNPEQLEDQVQSVIKTRIAVHNPDFLSFEENKNSKNNSLSKKELSPEETKIDSILDKYIRPGLQADGGDLELVAVKDNEVHISYQGACGGCPSAMMGTLEAIESILRQETGKDNLRVLPV